MANTRGTRLTPKNYRFVEEYLIDENAAAAARRAGYAEEHSGQIGHELLQKAEVIARLEQRREELAAAAEVTPERIVRELSRIAFVDTNNLLTDEGRMKEFSEIDEDTRAAINGLDIEELFEGRGEDREHIGRVKKVKLADKNKALENLGRYFGMFKDSMELKGKLATVNMEPKTPEEAALAYAALCKG